LKYREYLIRKKAGEKGGTGYRNARTRDGLRRPLTADEMNGAADLADGWRIHFRDNLTSQSMGRSKGEGAASWFPVRLQGQVFWPMSVRWKTNEEGMDRLTKAGRIEASGNDNLGYVRYLDDFPAYRLSDLWSDTAGQNQFGADKVYVVQTALTLVQRCILMTTDPSDLVLYPTCGSGTTAYVAEQWGRRWITVDTSPVALALARARLMSARYPYYLLADSVEGRRKEQEVSGKILPDSTSHQDVRQGFVYERVPHIMLNHIANNSEIDVIHEKWQAKLESLRAELNTLISKKWEEWEIPCEAGDPWPEKAASLLAKAQDANLSQQQRAEALVGLNASLKRAYTLDKLPSRPYDDWVRTRRR